MEPHLGRRCVGPHTFAGLGSVAAIPPWVAFAQQNDRLRRVDVLFAEATEYDPYYEGRLAALTEALRGLG